MIAHTMITEIANHGRCGIFCSPLVLRLFTFILVFFFILSLLPLPVSAAASIGNELTGFVNFFDLVWKGVCEGKNWWAYHVNGAEDICPDATTSDGHHDFQAMHTQVGGAVGNYYICRYCGKSAGEVLDTSYDSYVSDLNGLTGIDSKGGLMWYPTLDDLVSYPSESQNSYFQYLSPLYFGSISDFPLSSSDYRGEVLFDVVSPRVILFDFTNALGGGSAQFSFKLHFRTPPFAVSNISSIVSPMFIFDCDGSVWAKNYSISNFWAFDASSVITLEYRRIDGQPSSSTCRGMFYFPVFRIIPYTGALDPATDATYGADSRAATIVGDYGIIGDNGEISVIENQQIVNEGSSTVYNPVTNTTYNVTNWSYDYSDRSYNVTTAEGTSLGVTYGDEALTIRTGDLTIDASDTANYTSTTEGSTTIITDNSTGDTVSTVYNIYYVIQQEDDSGSGSGTEDPTPTPTLNPGSDTGSGSGSGGTTISGGTFKLHHIWEGFSAFASQFWEGLCNLFSAITGWFNAKTAILTGEAEAPASSASGGMDVHDNNITIYNGSPQDVSSGDMVTNNDYHITYEDGDGEEESVSVLGIVEHFSWVWDVRDIGQSFFSQIAANEQAAYQYNAEMQEVAQLARAPNALAGEVQLLDVESFAANPAGAPSIKLNLGAAQSVFGYVYGGEVEALDLSWYTPYKKTVDDLVSGFLWLLFLWGLFKKAPGIISGVGMTEIRLNDVDRGAQGSARFPREKY